MAIVNAKEGLIMACRILLLALSVSICSSLAYADFTLTPGVDLRVEYNDNIFLTADNEEDDFIATISPNISLDWETERLDVSMFAIVGMEKYLDHTEEDRVGADSNQSSSLNMLAKLYRELLFLRVSDSYSRVPIDEAGPGGENNRTVNMTDSNTFTVNPYLEFQPMKDTSVHLGYSYVNQWYGNKSNSDDTDNRGDDAESHIYDTSLQYELSPRISVSLSGSLKQYRPKDPLKVMVDGGGGAYEYDQTSTNVSITYKPSDRLNLNGSYGHSWLEYDVRSDSDSDTWSAGADYELTSSFTTGATYTKDYAVSVDSGPSESERFTVYLEYDERFTLRGSIFASTKKYVEIDRDEDSYGVEISGEVPFNDKTGISGSARYTNFDQSGFDAEGYDRYSSRLALYYDTRIGRISTGYIFNKNVSEQDNGDYINNIVYVDASLKF